MNSYEADVLACSPRDAYALLRVGRSRLAVRPWPGLRKGERTRLRIRPADVVLCADPPGRVSARNVLPGHVVSVKRSLDGEYVTVDVGFRLAALVTSAAVAELRLRKGCPVFALIKATAVASDAEVRPRFVLSVLGRNGRFREGQIEFLRRVDEEGSLLGAAKVHGISYRTAWLWVGEMNRAWGRPLVGRVHGGRGGGGAVLTPDATALLRRIRDAERRINGGGS